MISGYNSSYWDYFDKKKIKLASFIECAIVIHRVLSVCLLQSENKIKLQTQSKIKRKVK